MKRTVIILALALTACGDDASTGETNPPAAPAKPAAAPAGKPAGGAAQPKPEAASPAGAQSVAGVNVPSQDEADAQAAAAITEANADAEFEKLKKELEGENP
jgi:hypothetical protein